MNEPKTLFDRFKLRVKNNPVLASLIMIGTIVIALSTFTNATKNLWELVTTDIRPDINGKWQAEVTYDWSNARYSETFMFRGEGEDIYGTASFLARRRGILEGRVKNKKLQFITKTLEILGDASHPEKVEHHYYGRILNGEINFVMSTEGSPVEHTPIEFTAIKVSNAPQQSMP